MLSLINPVSMAFIKSCLLFLFFFSFSNSRLLTFLFFAVVIVIVSTVLNSGLVISHDSIVYYIPFYEVDTWREFEPGFTVINSLFRNAGFSAIAFINTIGTISLLLFVFSIWRLSGNTSLFYLMLFLSFCTLSFNFLATGLLRQYLAFSIILLASSFYYLNKRVGFYLSLFFATAIHFSSILYFFVLFVFRISWANKLYLLIFSFLFSFISKDVVLLILNNIPFSDSNVYIRSLVRGLGYSDKNIVHGNYFFKYLFVFISLLAVGVGKFYLELRDGFEKLVNVLYSFTICGFFVSSACYFASEASIRVLYGVAIFSTLTFASLLMGAHFKNRIIIMGLACLPFFFYSFLSHDWIVDFVNRYI